MFYASPVHKPYRQQDGASGIINLIGLKLPAYIK